jgi:PIN domain nuclease of toxin-antitoxin system
MLVAQAMSEGLTIVSADQDVARYPSRWCGEGVKSNLTQL